MKSRLLWISAWLCMAAMSFAARAAPTYEVVVVGGAGSAAYGINSTGQVVGQLKTAAGKHAFYFDGATLSDLGTLGGANSVAWSINDSGTVVGRANTAGNGLQAFVYSGGTLSALPAELYDARSVNNAGTIVGTGYLPDGMGSDAARAYTYAGGVVTDLGILPGNDGNESYGYGINNAGVAVGAVEVGGAPNRPTDPFLYSAGAMHNLGNIGGVFSQAWAINSASQVVGAIGAPYLGDANVYPAKAFLWDAGVLHTLGEFIPNGNSIAYDINDGGQVVGSADTADGARAFLYAGSGMVALDTLIDPASGWTITAANGINDLQQIAATACNLAGCYAVRLDLAAAVPEPGQSIMLGLGLLALCMPALRRACRPACPSVRAHLRAGVAEHCLYAVNCRSSSMTGPRPPSSRATKRSRPAALAWYSKSSAALIQCADASSCALA